MKTRYVTPRVEIVECRTMEMIAASGVYSDTTSISYGGVDVSGEYEAEARRLIEVLSWDD